MNIADNKNPWHFHGSMAMIRVSSGVRYRENFVPKDRFESDKDTIALYHFDEGQGNILKDSSGNGRHGKIIGAKWVKVNGGVIEPKVSPAYRNSLGMEFALVPKGKAWLGGGGGKPGDKEVEFKEDFYLGVYEVTVAEWAKVLGQTPRGGKPSNQRFPAEGVTWNDCQRFVKRLNEMAKEAGWEYRLPTGDEWEYACRGGPMRGKEESAFDFYLEKPSNELRPDQANHLGKNVCVVGSYKPNRLGIYDMHGNVAEWCNDAEQPLPKDPTLAKRRIYGGAWGGRDARKCTAAQKSFAPPSRRESYLGLRLARVRVGGMIEPKKK